MDCFVFRMAEVIFSFFSKKSFESFYRVEGAKWNVAVVPSFFWVGGITPWPIAIKSWVVAKIVFQVMLKDLVFGCFMFMRRLTCPILAHSSCDGALLGPTIKGPIHDLFTFTVVTTMGKLNHQWYQVHPTV